MLRCNASADVRAATYSVALLSLSLLVYSCHCLPFIPIQGSDLQQFVDAGPGALMMADKIAGTDIDRSRRAAAERTPLPPCDNTTLLDEPGATTNATFASLLPGTRLVQMTLAGDTSNSFDSAQEAAAHWQDSAQAYKLLLNGTLLIHFYNDATNQLTNSVGRWGICGSIMNVLIEHSTSMVNGSLTYVGSLNWGAPRSLGLAWVGPIAAPAPPPTLWGRPGLMRPLRPSPAAPNTSCVELPDSPATAPRPPPFPLVSAAAANDSQFDSAAADAQALLAARQAQAPAVGCQLLKAGTKIYVVAQALD
ncbi:hypothetical protein V8C86DRAFT_2682519 [Haematococcus lacustris]